MTITGVTISEIKSAFHRHMRAGISSTTWDIPKSLTAEERATPVNWSASELRMISCIVRRTGLLVGMGGHSVDLWRREPERISVEAFFSQLPDGRGWELLTSMASPELAPRLVPSGRSGDDNYHTHFEVEDRSCEFDLRIQVTGRSRSCSSSGE